MLYSLQRSSTRLLFSRPLLTKSFCSTPYLEKTSSFRNFNTQAKEFSIRPLASAQPNMQSLTTTMYFLPARLLGMQTTSIVTYSYSLLGPLVGCSSLLNFCAVQSQHQGQVRTKASTSQNILSQKYQCYTLRHVPSRPQWPDSLCNEATIFCQSSTLSTTRLNSRLGDAFAQSIFQITLNFLAAQRSFCSSDLDSLSRFFSVSNYVAMF